MKPLTLRKSGRLLSPPQTKRLRSGFVVLKPGQSVGEHTTGKREEIIIVLKGTARLLANRKNKKIKATSVAYNPPHTVHNVTNCGKNALQYIYVVS
ncbi:MAG: cupin domain-containing protein [Patescibacteria group bacterium]